MENTEGIPVTVRLTEGEPVAGGFVALTFKMRERADVSCILGPSTPDGTVSITEAEVAQTITQRAADFPMDHLGPDGFTGAITAAILDRDSTERALQAAETWGNLAALATEERRASARDWLTYLQPGTTIEIEVISAPTSITVEVSR